MKITLTLAKTITYDINDPMWDEFKKSLLEKMSENEDNVRDGQVVMDPTAVHDAIEELITEDYSVFLDDLNLGDSDFKVEVTS